MSRSRRSGAWPVTLAGLTAHVLTGLALAGAALNSAAPIDFVGATAQAETIKAESFKTESVKSESIKSETVKTETRKTLTSFDRPGGDYASAAIPSGDPADCALLCERDRRCHAWSFNYPNETVPGAVCWLKNTVPPRVQDECCVSGVRGAGVVEPRSFAVETSIDRAGGDYRSFDMTADEGEEGCRLACTADAKCRAWTYARPGYTGREPRCFLKKEIKPPHRRAGFSSGVVR